MIRFERRVGQQVALQYDEDSSNYGICRDMWFILCRHIHILTSVTELGLSGGAVIRDEQGTGIFYMLPVTTQPLRKI